MRGDAAPKIIMTSVEGGDSRDSIITRLVVGGGRGLADEFDRRHQPLPHTYTLSIHSSQPSSLAPCLQLLLNYGEVDLDG